MKRVDIFVVRTPFQLISAMSGKKLTNRTTFLVIELRDGKRSKNNEQLLQLLDRDCWDDIHFLISHNPLSRTISYWWLYIRLRRKNVGRVFVGEYREMHYHLFLEKIRAKERYLLDDGASTIYLQKKYLCNRSVFVNFEKVSILRKLHYFSVHFKWIRPDIFRHIFHLISEFELGGTRTRGQAVIRLIPERIKVSTHVDQVWYFGSKYYESGAMDMAVEVMIVAFIYDYYKGLGLTLAYIPHREEGPAKLEKVRALGVEVRDLGMPVESFISERLEAPSHIAAPWSTVLATLPGRFDFKSVTCFHIPLEYFDTKLRERAECIYDYYRGMSDIRHIDISVGDLEA